jgi:hypothetical protein
VSVLVVVAAAVVVVVVVVVVEQCHCDWLAHVVHSEQHSSRSRQHVQHSHPGYPQRQQ